MEAWQKGAPVVKKMSKSGQAGYFKKFPERESWFKQNHPDMSHFDTSAKQGSIGQKVDKAKQAAREKLSLQAHGATRGTKMGEVGGTKPEADKDTIKPLSREQHSKVQAAKREAALNDTRKAAATAPKPLAVGDKAGRLAAIKRLHQNSQSAAYKMKKAAKHDVATEDPDDRGHDDMMDIHHSLHIGGHQYNEEIEPRTHMSPPTVGPVKDQKSPEHHPYKLVYRKTEQKTNYRPQEHPFVSTDHHYDVYSKHNKNSYGHEKLVGHIKHSESKEDGHTYSAMIHGYEVSGFGKNERVYRGPQSPHHYLGKMLRDPDTKERASHHPGFKFDRDSAGLKEEVEQVDEVSKKTISSYINKTIKRGVDPHPSKIVTSNRDNALAAKVGKAYDKLHGVGVKVPATNEEIEQMDEGVRKWTAQVRKDHGQNVKFWNQQTGGGAVNNVQAKNSKGDTVGVYNRKSGHATVFAPKTESATVSLKDIPEKKPRKPVDRAASAMRAAQKFGKKQSFKDALAKYAKGVATDNLKEGKYVNNAARREMQASMKPPSTPEQMQKARIRAIKKVTKSLKDLSKRLDAAKKPVTEGVDSTADKIEAAPDTKSAKAVIAKAATRHLKTLMNQNMGYSGAGKHPMIKHIAAELKARKLKEDPDHAPVAPAHPVRSDIEAGIKAYKGSFTVGGAHRYAKTVSKIAKQYGWTAKEVHDHIKSEAGGN
jgi:hypothetical protein